MSRSGLSQRVVSIRRLSLTRSPDHSVSANSSKRADSLPQGDSTGLCHYQTRPLRWRFGLPTEESFPLHTQFATIFEEPK